MPTGGADICLEICGNGRRLNNQTILTFDMPCDDANTLSNDGCSSLCKVELGFACTGGGPNSSDICLEICGDGINLGHYQCDDGNNID